MQTPDISSIALIAGSLILIVPILINMFFRLGLFRSMLSAVVRMSLQLILIGIFLKYLFQYNYAWLNSLWLLIMIVVAAHNVVTKILVSMGKLIAIVFFALMISTVSILLLFNWLLLDLSNVLDARYLIVIGGMLLGNSLRSDIVGLDNFFRSIKRNENRYLYRLASGATQIEALVPYFRNSLVSAFQPTLATMATMGIVFLPGMMTGQILGGVSPILAIKYQIAIMIAIFASTALTVVLTLLFGLKICFNDLGAIDKTVFIDKKIKGSIK